MSMKFDLEQLQKDLIQLRGNLAIKPDASIIIPVNARADLKTVFTPLLDIANYLGKYKVEIILMINNFPETTCPAEIELFRKLGCQVVAHPNARRPGEVIIVSARALGVQAAKSDVTIHLDADCRIPDVTSLVNWYIETIRVRADLAYSHVGYYDLRKRTSIYFKIGIHHFVRWKKRNILRIPTTRGSNYAIKKSHFLDLYNEGKLSVDLQVGPAAKLFGSRIAYSSKPNLRVLTSGRRFHGGWLKMFRYFAYRLHFNVKATPTRKREVTRTSWEGFDKETDNRNMNQLATANHQPNRK